MARYRNMTVRDSGLIVPSYVDEETYGDKSFFRTKLYVNTTLGAIAGGANLALGKLILTLPSLECVILAAAMSLAIKQTEAHITADTPDIGLGTTLASGVQALLSGVGATAENILTGQTAADCNGTATVETVANQPLALTTGGVNKTIYANVADGWAASGDAAAKLYGTVELWWMQASF